MLEYITGGNEYNLYQTLYPSFIYPFSNLYGNSIAEKIVGVCRGTTIEYSGDRLSIQGPCPPDIVSEITGI